MGKFKVVVYDRLVRHFEKEFDADSEEQAAELANAEEQTPANGWIERYEEMLSEQHIECVEDLTDEGWT